MKRLIFILSLGWAVVSLSVMADVQDLYTFDQPQQSERFDLLSQEVRCLVCQNQSIADSNAPLAKDLRNKIYEMIKVGHSDTAIRSYLVKRYGEYVMFKPSLRRETVVLWILPFGFIGFAAMVVFSMTTRKQKAQSKRQRV